MPKKKNFTEAFDTSADDVEDFNFSLGSLLDDESDAPFQIDIPDNAIVPTDSGFQYKRFLLTAVGMDVPKDTATDEWIELVQVLRKLEESIQWIIGDLVNHAAMEWGKSYEQLASLTGYKARTLYDYAYVARSVDFSMRIEKLGFQHHQLVAGLKDDEGHPIKTAQKQWLQRAATNDWSVAEMRRQMKADATQTKTHYTIPSEIQKRYNKDQRDYTAWMSDVNTMAARVEAGYKLSSAERDEYLKRLQSVKEWIDERQKLLGSD